MSTTVKNSLTHSNRKMHLVHFMFSLLFSLSFWFISVADLKYDLTVIQYVSSK